MAPTNPAPSAALRAALPGLHAYARSVAGAAFEVLPEVLCLGAVEGDAYLVAFAATSTADVAAMEESDDDEGEGDSDGGSGSGSGEEDDDEDEDHDEDDDDEPGEGVVAVLFRLWPQAEAVTPLGWEFVEGPAAGVAGALRELYPTYAPLQL